MNKVYVEGLPDPISAPSARTLLALLRSRQVQIPFACGGRGSCGLCKVYVQGQANPCTPEEENLLRQRERDIGARLACQVKPAGDLNVKLPKAILAAREYRATLLSAKQKTKNISSFILELPGATGFSFEAGAFILLRIPQYPGNRLVLQRPYSLASPPSQAKRLELNIRRVSKGAGTTYLFEHLKPGDPVVFFGPYGDFQLSDSQRPIIFMAGGSGLSPVKSMLAELADAGSRREVTFIFGAHSQASLFDLDAMQEYAQRLPNFRFIPTLTEPADAWHGEKGTVTEAGDRIIPWGSDFEAYLCGSPGMIAAALELLHNNNVPDERIFYDQFN